MGFITLCFLFSLVFVIFNGICLSKKIKQSPSLTPQRSKSLSTSISIKSKRDTNKLKEDFESELEMIKTIDSSTQESMTLNNSVETISTPSLKHNLKFKSKKYEPCEIVFISSDEMDYKEVFKQKSDKVNKKDDVTKESINFKENFIKIDVSNLAARAMVSTNEGKVSDQREIEVKSKQLTSWESDSDDTSETSDRNHTNWD